MIDNTALGLKYYSDGVRVQMLINRGVGNTNKGSKRWLNKLISYDRESYANNLMKLINQQDYLNNPDIRLYCCVNERKLSTAVKLLHHAMIDVPENDYVGFYSNIHNNLISKLMKPECRASKRFLIDVDTNDKNKIEEIISVLGCNEIHVLDRYKTVKGVHFITKPFDVRIMDDINDVEVKTDGIMLLRVL